MINEIVQNQSIFTSRRSFRRPLIMITSFSVISFLFSFNYLRGEFAAGMDGGYYELQVFWLLEHGELYFEGGIILLGLGQLLAVAPAVTLNKNKRSYW